MNSSKWYLNSVFYQIYPQSFQDTNGDGIGDLEGIISRLDYLKSLGTDAALRLNLTYLFPFEHAGYDVALAFRSGMRSSLERSSQNIRREKYHCLFWSPRSGRCNKRSCAELASHGQDYSVFLVKPSYLTTCHTPWRKV